MAAGGGQDAENISDLVSARKPSSLSSGGGKSIAATATERANLLNLSKLCIKNLIESSLKLCRTLAEEHVPLQQFFIIMEHVLRHGLKGRRQLNQCFISYRCSCFRSWSVAINEIDNR